MTRPMPNPLVPTPPQTSEPVQEQIEPQREVIQEPIYYYDTPPEKEVLPFDRQMMIFMFAAFFVGFLLGSLRRPVILKT